MEVRGFTKQYPVSALALGICDGCHLGHQLLLSRADALLSFSPHPDKVLKKNPDIKVLTTDAERRYYIPNQLFLDFTTQIASLSATDFLDQIHAAIGFTSVVVGDDFQFGHQQGGCTKALKHWGDENGVHIQVMDSYSDEKGHAIKSQNIRRLLAEGDLDTAVEDLGHSYLILGTVVPGEGRGKDLGFPTANLSVPADKQLPGPGVYAADLIRAGRYHSAIVYIGSKPTFHATDGSQSIEVHIPGLDDDLYSEELAVFLTKFIRGEQKFASSEELVSQIQKDLAQI